MIDILLSSSYFVVNTKLCKELGFREGIFFSALFNQLQNDRKNKRTVYIEGKEYFAISRTKILDVTSISKESQRKLQFKLIEKGLLEMIVLGVRKMIYYRIDESVLEDILINPIMHN